MLISKQSITKEGQLCIMRLGAELEVGKAKGEDIYSLKIALNAFKFLSKLVIKLISRIMINLLPCSVLFLLTLRDL